jgi:rhamnosyl/mannosyltransferase
VATSPNYLATSKLLQRVQERVDVIPLGLAPESYQPASIDALRQVEQGYGVGFYLFIGVLRYYKGLQFLVEAAAQNGLPVVIAGRGSEHKALEAQAKSSGASNIKFAGFVSDDIKQALMARAKAIVFPSCERSEAFGVTLLEGQMHSLPLITCDIGTGTSFVNQHGVTGLVVPPRNATALSDAMRQLEENPETAERMGRAGRERLNNVFSGSQVGEKYTSLYRKLLESESGSNKPS